MSEATAREKALTNDINVIIEEVLDDLIEFDNGGSSVYTTGDIATKVFRLRELWRMYSNTN